MFRHEEGYAPDTGNWFWAKYLPDQTPEGMPIAHRAASLIGRGDDYLFTTKADLQ